MCVCVCVLCVRVCVRVCMCACACVSQIRVPEYMATCSSVLTACAAILHFHLHLCLAAGKSTFLELLQKAHPEYIIVNEPLVRWQNVPDGVEGEGLTCSQQHGGNLLDHFYKDPQRWGYTFQV